MTEIIVNLDPLRDSILENLRNNICVITFIKKDGSQRQMKCTLHASQLPAPKEPLKEVIVEAPKPATQEDQIRVFDLEVNAWRSFVLGNFIGIHAIENLEY